MILGVMSAFTIKFMFADATTVSETFDAGTLVIDAKRKIIAAWPDGSALPNRKPQGPGLTLTGLGWMMQERTRLTDPSTSK